MTRDEYNKAIQDWLSILNLEEKEETKYIRQNITELRKEYYKNKKRSKQLS